jgi:hypothetical protein
LGFWSVICVVPGNYFPIPQLYYGTEILMHDFDKPTDFPEGWKGDEMRLKHLPEMV